LTLTAQPIQETDMLKKKESKASKAAETKSDAEILKCIADKFSVSKSIKNGVATVTNGEATLTGEAKSGGAKGGATRSAQACGAQKVTNKITLSEDSKKTADKKSEPTKK
jgi:osmotically-inducible protein OsmY